MNIDRDMERKLYTTEEFTADIMKLKCPQQYEEREKEGYLKNRREKEPAVISINMAIAAMTINDFLDRIDHYRNDDQSKNTRFQINYREMILVPDFEYAPQDMDTPKRLCGSCDIEYLKQKFQI